MDEEFKKSLRNECAKAMADVVGGYTNEAYRQLSADFYFIALGAYEQGKKDAAKEIAQKTGLSLSA